MLVGTTPSRVEVSLRIRGADLEPTSISARLGCVADVGYVRGHLLSVRANAKAREGLWMLEQEGSHDADLSSVVLEVLSRTTSDPEIWLELANQYECDVFLGIWTETDNTIWALSRPAMQELALRQLSVEFDVYSIRERDE